MIVALHDHPFLLLIAALPAFYSLVEIGYRLGQRGRRVEEKYHEQFAATRDQAGVLLSLLLGFTLAMALSRYDVRKQQIVEEANAIGTMQLRGALLPSRLARKPDPCFATMSTRAWRSRARGCPQGFGRIAAQYAKQALMQKVRQAEKAMLLTEYKDRVGDIVSGTVRRFDRSDVILDLGKYEALMPNKERVPTEEYQVGERIRCYVKAVQEGPHGPEIILSRADTRFIVKLFQLEVSEINDGTIEIKGIAREPGFRTKMAVYSRDSKGGPGWRVRRHARPAREEYRPRVEQRKGGRDSVVVGHQGVRHQGAGTGENQEHRSGRSPQDAEHSRRRRPAFARHRQARPERAADGAADRLGSGH